MTFPFAIITFLIISAWANMKPTNLRVKTLSKRFDIPVSTIWALTKRGVFPQPERPTTRLTLWNVAEVEEWIKSKNKISSTEDAHPDILKEKKPENSSSEKRAYEDEHALVIQDK